MNECQANLLLEKIPPIPERSQLKRLELTLENIPTQEPCTSGNLLNLSLFAKDVEAFSRWRNQPMKAGASGDAPAERMR